MFYDFTIGPAIEGEPEPKRPFLRLLSAAVDETERLGDAGYKERGQVRHWLTSFITSQGPGLHDINYKFWNRMLWWLDEYHAKTDPDYDRGTVKVAAAEAGWPYGTHTASIPHVMHDANEARYNRDALWDAPRSLA